MTIPFSRKCVVLLACGAVFAFTGCHPKHLEEIKTTKAEAEKLVEAQHKAALELSGLGSQLDVLGKDSKRAEDEVTALEKQKGLLEKELDRLTKLGESIVTQRETLKKEHSSYAKKFSSK